MVTFLDEVVSDILKKNNINELKNCTIVLPSRRAGLHLKNSFSKKIAHTLLLPKITTINEFICNFSNLSPITYFEAQLELYSSYCKVKDDPEQLDSFIHLAPKILNDFNLIDKHLLDSNTFMFDLSSVTEIDNWSLNEENLTENQNDYVEFWKFLGALYTQFHQDLNDKGFATEGTIYRSVSMEINARIDDSPVFFVGLNALSSSEEKIISEFIKSGYSKVYFDGDNFYCSDKNHEAGFFFRKSKVYAKSSFNNHFLSNKEITIYPTKNDVEQVQTISKILEKKAVNESSVAVYLINENLINPLINTIPTQIKKLNITMGYPVVNSYSYAFLIKLISLFENSNSNEIWDNEKLNYKIIEELFTLPFVKKLTKKILQETIFWKKVLSKNSKFIDLEELSIVFPTLESILSFRSLKKLTTSQKFIEELIHYIEYILSLVESKIERECISIMLLDLTKIQRYILNYPHNDKISCAVMIKVIKVRWSTLSTPFYGEPLAGVQIMGFLESRALDFEHVVLASCNESFLPGSEQDQSLIPRDLKKHYNIPGIFEKDAMFSYYFYRSIQRAKKIDLLYSTNSNSKLISPEPSRFIQQIERELKNPIIEVKRKSFDFKYSKFKTKEIVQNEFSKTQLFALFERGLSASSIKKYLDCPLDFYNRYILKIKEKELVEEIIESRTWGSILHFTLKKLYKDQKTITIDVINQLRKKSLRILNDEFKLKFPDGRFNKGENSLLYHESIKCLELFFDNEEKNILENGSFTVLSVEEDYSHVLNIDVGNKKINVKLKGDIDRVDQTSKGVRIVDYKSGFLTKKDTEMKNHNDFSSTKYCLQLMLYAFLYNKKTNQRNIKSSIVSLRNPTASYIDLVINDKNTIDEDELSNFEGFIKDFVTGLLLKDLEYKHNPKQKYCMSC